jgi:spore coat protein U-like protein
LNNSTNLTVTCNTAVTPINVGLNTGLNGTYTAGTVYTRKMNSGAVMLNYGLYQNAGLTTNWGTTTGTDTLATAYTTTAVTVPVYGTIPAGQVVATGSYADTITASIYF